MSFLTRMLYPFWALRARQRMRKALPYYRRAESLLLKVNVDRAIQEITAALRIDPDNPQGHLRRADYYLIKGLDDLALKDFSYVINLEGAVREVAYRGAIRDPLGRTEAEQDLAEALKGRGQIHLSRGDHDLALADFNTAIEIGHASAAAILRPGDFFRSPRNSLLSDFSQAAVLFSSRGGALLAKGQYERAIFSFDVAILHGTEARTVSQAYNKKGIALTSLAEYEQAIQNFDESLRNYPVRMDTDREIVGVLKNRGRSHHRRGEFDLAVSDFRTAQLVETLELDEHRDRAEFFSRIGDYARTVLECNSHLDTYPEEEYGPDYEIYGLRGEAYLGMREYEQAISDLDVAHPVEQMDPAMDVDILAAYFNKRGLANMGSGQFDLAIADFSEAIDIDPDSAESYRNRGRAFEAKGEQDLARADFQLSFQDTQPDPLDDFYDRATYYEEAGELEMLIAEYSAAIDNYPADGFLYALRGEALIKKMERELADGAEPGASRALLELAGEDYKAAVNIDTELALALTLRDLLSRHRSSP